MAYNDYHQHQHHQHHHHQQHPQHQHAYPHGYSNQAYMENTSHSPISPHPIQSPQTTSDRVPVPQSPSSFIYNRTPGQYPSSSDPYGNEDISQNPHSYHQGYHQQLQPNVSMMYRHHPLERQDSFEDQRQQHHSPRHPHPPHPPTHQTHQTHPSHPSHPSHHGHSGHSMPSHSHGPLPPIPSIPSGQPHHHPQHSQHSNPQHEQPPVLPHPSQYGYHQPMSSPPSESVPLTGQEIYAAADVHVVLSEEQDRLMRAHFPHFPPSHSHSHSSHSSHSSPHDPHSHSHSHPQANPQANANTNAKVNANNANLRRALWFIIHSTWKQNNEREPTDEALLQFTTRNGKLYQCLFWKQDGRCVKEFDRKDRVLDHIRTHIDLQPFTCREGGCFQRFCSKPDLLQHEKNKEKTQCDQCGAKILPKNLARHKATALCRSGRWPVNGVIP